MKPVERLERVARLLEPFRDRMVFVGGATLALMITDKAAGGIRSTDDVDLVIPVPTHRAYERDVSKQLRRLGFKNDLREDAPICRWVFDDLTVDVMPVDASVLGFSNRWYADGVARAETVELAWDLSVRVFTAPYFLASKLEAFKDRGKGDFLSSADHRTRKASDLPSHSVQSDSISPSLSKCGLSSRCSFSTSASTKPLSRKMP